MKKTKLFPSRLLAAVCFFTCLCLTTTFYACGISKEEAARKEAIEKTERMTSPAPAPASAPKQNGQALQKLEMKMDTMR